MLAQDDLFVTVTNSVLVAVEGWVPMRTTVGTSSLHREFCRPYFPLTAAGDYRVYSPTLSIAVFVAL